MSRPARSSICRPWRWSRSSPLFLIIGVKTSAKFNNVMVAIKLTIVLVVIFVGFCHIVAGQPHALHSAQHRHLRAIRLERRVPRHGRDLLRLYRLRCGQRGGAGSAGIRSATFRIGILGSLIICTVLYMLMSLGADRHRALSSRSMSPIPSAQAVEALPAHALAGAVRQYRRHRRPGLGGAGAAARPVAHLLCDGADGMIPPLFSRDPSALPHALERHASSPASFCGAAGRVSAARHSGRAGLHRHAGRPSSSSASA